MARRRLNSNFHRDANDGKGVDAEVARPMIEPVSLEKAADACARMMQGAALLRH